MAMASVSQLGTLGINAADVQYLFLWVAEFEEQLHVLGGKNVKCVQILLAFSD